MKDLSIGYRQVAVNPAPGKLSDNPDDHALTDHLRLSQLTPAALHYRSL